MAGDVEPEDLLLLRESLRLAHGRNVGQRHVSLFRRSFPQSRVPSPQSPKQRSLPLLDLLLLERGFLNCRVQHRDELRAMPAETIHRTRVDERFEDALVAQPEVDALAEVEQRLGWLLRARREHRVDCRLADVPDRAESESDPLLADDRELVARLVHVRGEYLDPELARLVDEL